MAGGNWPKPKTTCIFIISLKWCYRVTDIMSIISEWKPWIFNHLCSIKWKHNTPSKSMCTALTKAKEHKINCKWLLTWFIMQNKKKEFWRDPVSVLTCAWWGKPGVHPQQPLAQLKWALVLFECNAKWTGDCPKSRKWTTEQHRRAKYNQNRRVYRVLAGETACVLVPKTKVKKSDTTPFLLTVSKEGGCAQC